MRRLFGSRKDDSAASSGKPSLQEASAKIDLQVQILEEKIGKADEEIRQHVSKGTTNPTAKQRALQAMKRKKMYEQQRDQLLGTQFNVESLAFQHEQADVTMTAVEAMKAGQELLKQQHEKINISQVDKLTDDMAELNDEMKAINEALAQSSPALDGCDEGDLAAEYAKMEEEVAAMALAGGVPSTAPLAPGVAAPAESLPAAAGAASPDHLPEAVPSAPP